MLPGLLMKTQSDDAQRSEGIWLKLQQEKIGLDQPKWAEAPEYLGTDCDPCCDSSLGGAHRWLSGSCGALERANSLPGKQNAESWEGWP